MMCDCVYRAMHQIQCQCKHLTRKAQQAYMQGEMELANNNFMQAFQLSRQLMNLPTITSTSINYFTNACFNCVQYGIDEEDRLAAIQQLEIAAHDLRNLIAMENFVEIREQQETAGVVLDSYMLICQTLVNELNSIHDLSAAQAISKEFTHIWKQHAHQHLRCH